MVGQEPVRTGPTGQTTVPTGLAAGEPEVGSGLLVPVWAIAGLAAVLLLGGAAFVVGGDGGGGRSCGADQARHLHLERDAGRPMLVTGADLRRAWDAGVERGESAEDVVINLAESGIAADPFTSRAFRETRDADVVAEEGGYEPGQVSCWIGTGADFAARGDFDRDQVEAAGAAAAGELAVEGDLLVGSPEGARSMLEPQDIPGESIGRLLDVVEAQEAISFTLALPADGGDAVPEVAALVHEDGWELAVTWLLPDDTAAGQAGEEVRAALAESPDAVLAIAGTEGEPGTLEGDPGDWIEQDGSLVRLRVPLRDPSRWAMAEGLPRPSAGG